jgi:hypothetical protein
MSRPKQRSKRPLKKLPELVAEKLAQRNAGDQRPVLIFAQDEARFGRISITRKSWAPAGIRPRSPRQVIRKYVYVYSAVCPATGKMTSLILPKANSEMMSLFLQQVSSDFADYFIIMLVDRAGWHVSARLIIPENIRLIPIPSHSPELNPTEHVWDELREKHFPNLALKTLDEVEDKLCDGLNAMTDDPERLRSLTYFPYLHITV